MKNLISFQSHVQSRNWIKMLHDLSQVKEDLCYLEYRGTPKFAPRLLSRLTNIANRFNANPVFGLKQMQIKANVLWLKNNKDSDFINPLQADVTKHPSLNFDLDKVSILHPRIH